MPEPLLGHGPAVTAKTTPTWSAGPGRSAPVPEPTDTAFGTILVVNAGSSSLKLGLIDGTDVLSAADIDDWDGTADEALAAFLAGAPPVAAVGHRIVHGGTEFTTATIIDNQRLARIADFAALAPLHQPRAVAAVQATRRALPAVPALACFDTADHAALPAAAATYALPESWRSRWPLRRFGFHGLSHAYAARRASAMVGQHQPALRTVSCHRGAGASLCASVGSRSVDTTMGFTPLEGVVMQTRSGTVDPGLVLWLITEAGLDAVDVRATLEHRSGLAGLAGGTGDMRDVLARRATGDEHASLAFDVYVYSLVRGIGSMVASAGGVDVLAFTGGIGEHSPAVRQAVANRLTHLGAIVDPAANRDASCDADITAAGAQVAALVVTAREDLEIARQTRHALQTAGTDR